MKILRSFLGAFLCALFGTWPALAYDSHWVVIPFGIVGWIIGYHGDRFYVGLRQGVWEFGGKIDGLISTLSVALTRLKNGFMSVLKGVRDWFVWFGTGLIWCAGAGSRLLGQLPEATASAAHRAWKNFRARSGHPMTIAYNIHRVTDVLIFGGIALYVWQLFYSLTPEIGTVVTINEISSSRDYVVEARHKFGEASLYTFLVMLPALFVSIRYFVDSMPEDMTGFYRRHQRFADLGFIRFTLFEVLAAIRYCVFGYMVVAIAVACLAVFLSLGGIGMVTIAFVGLPLAAIIYSGTHTMWAIAKADKDYGIGSLGVGLAVAFVAYLVTNGESIGATQQLFTSLVAGFAAGLVSTTFTLVDQIFGDVRIKKNALAVLIEPSFDSVEHVLTKAVKSLWNINLLILPQDRRYQAA